MTSGFTPPGDSTLRRSALAGGDARRFLADEAGTETLAALGAAAGAAAHFGGLSLLLAMPDQRAMVRALLALDGVARRVVIWPEDGPPADLERLRAAASIDAVLTAWPPAESAAGPGAADCYETEWVLLTSGSTGRPKLVLHTRQTLAGHLLAAPVPDAAPVWCSFYDIRRYGGMQVMLRALLGGGSLVLAGADEPPAALLRRAARHGATHFLGTPSHWRRALMSGAAGLIRPDYVRLSGEIADQGILDRLRAAFPAARLVHAFASTEAGLAAEVADGRAGLPVSVLGRGGGFAEIALVDGTLRVRSPRNALGYLDGVCRQLNGEGGFVDTGDRVEQRGERLFFAGRADGVINVGGQKIHPETVESVLHQHPSVAMCAVRARANPITGALVAADVVAVPEAVASPAALRDFCRAHLPPHMVPATIRLVPRLDIAASGKVARGLA